MLFLEHCGASMPSLLEYVFAYILAAVLLFQGLHLFQETEAPLGTLPEEAAQATGASQKWGAALMTWACFALGTGLLSHAYAWFASAVLPMRNVGLILLAAYGAWVVFAGRSVEFMGKPSADDHHGHDHGHAADHGHH